jgi:hypothetical protein
MPNPNLTSKDFGEHTMIEIPFKDLQEGQKFFIKKATFTKGRSNGVQGGFGCSGWRQIDDDKIVKIKSEGFR